MGRFINADAFASTGQGLLGNNMFAYCVNNPVSGYDPTGNFVLPLLTSALIKFGIKAIIKSVGKALIGAAIGGALGGLSEWAMGGSDVGGAILKGALFGAASSFEKVAPFVVAIEVYSTIIEVVQSGKSFESGLFAGLIEFLSSLIQLPKTDDIFAKYLAELIIGAGQDLSVGVASEVVTSFSESYIQSQNSGKVSISAPYYGGVGGGPRNTKHMLH